MSRRTGSWTADPRYPRPRMADAVLSLAAASVTALACGLACVPGASAAVPELPSGQVSVAETQEDPVVDLASLLTELADPTAPAREPRLRFESRLVTSRDPRSVDPADAVGWYANEDRGHALRTETVDGADGPRQEWVIADLDGPGAVVRLWTAFEENQTTTVLRVRLDGASKPVLEAPLQELLSGRGVVPPPIAAVQAPGGRRWRSGVGGVMLLPIPFARRCTVTLDRPPGYWQVAWRRYPDGTEVRSLPDGWPDAARSALARAANALGEGPRATVADAPAAEDALPSIAPDGATRVALDGPARIDRLAIRLHPSGDEELRSALRDLWLEADFDGEACVRVPVGHFAGLGECRPPVEDRWRSARAAADGTLLLEWTMPMPFARSAVVVLRNAGGRTHRATIESIATDALDPASVGSWRRLHAAFREDLAFAVADPDDWSMLSIEGAGEVVGHSLAYMNGSTDWWGEGDEKIRIDGEALPSQFGTGTEDFIGTAWGFPRALSSPFVSVAPRDDTARWTSRGRTAVSRLRGLDGIVFTRSIDLAIERIPIPARGGRATIAATTLWYAAPGASRALDAQEPARMPPNPEPPELARFVDGPGAWHEAEDLAVVDASADLKWTVQEIGTIAPRFAWSGGRQVFVQSDQPGEFWSVEVPVGDSRRVARSVRLELRFANAPDYAAVDIEIDGVVRRRGHSLRASEVRPGAAVVLEQVPVAPGRATVLLTLRVSTDGDDGSERPRFIGIDAVRVASTHDGAGFQPRSVDAHADADERHSAPSPR